MALLEIPTWDRDPFNGLILRDEWSKGKAKIGRLGNPMVLPVKYIFIHHSVTPVGDSPIQGMRTVNDVGIARFGMHSYSYNFWPDVNGHHHRVLQGQGGRKGAHSGAAWNAKAFGFCWIGNYHTGVDGHVTIVVTASMVHYTAAWIGYLIDNGVIDPNVDIRHHAQIKATACPGDHWIPEMDRLRELVKLGYRMSDYKRDFFGLAPAPVNAPPMPEPPVEQPVVPSPPVNPTVEEAKTKFEELTARVVALDERTLAHGSAIATHTQELAAVDNAVVKLQDVVMAQDTIVRAGTERLKTIDTISAELARRMGVLEAKPDADIGGIIEGLAARLATPAKE